MDLINLNDDELIQKIINTPSLSPCLVLGKYVSTFKRNFKGEIFNTYTLEDVKEIVDRFSGFLATDTALVLDGIGFLNSSGQNALLKFIEDSKFQIILLSYYDRVSPIIMSRLKFVFKKAETQINSLEFVSVKNALDLIEEKKKINKDFSEYDELRLFAELCPNAFIWKYSKDRFDYNAKKLVRMVSNAQ